MEKWKKRSVDLLTSLAFGSKDSPSVVQYYPQKTEIPSYEERYFLRTTPEKHGISSRRIYNLLCELENEPRANIHNLIILCGGEVIAECSRDGYSVNLPHLSHSMSKTVTGMAIGVLCDEGLLNTDARVVEFFPEVAYKDKRIASMTVFHLLTMRSGVSFNEAGAVTEKNWTEAFFTSSLKFAPGAKFAYNSMNSYILAVIVERVAKKSFISFVEEKLFSPLSITNFFWEKGPEGVEKGGWGLYMSVESWAKLGYMMSRGGSFGGRRILSEEWVAKSCERHSEAPDSLGDFDYGYQLWSGRGGKETLFNGMLGQNVWIYPENDIVAVINSGNNELFQESPALDILRKYLSGRIKDECIHSDVKTLHERETRFFDSRRWVIPLDKKRGLFYWLGIKSKTPFDERLETILGEYAFADNNVGILPLLVSAMQNNLNAKIERLKLERVGEALYMTVKESGEEYKLAVGLYGYEESILNMRGERYIVKAMASVAVSAETETEYRIELLFPELPNTRMMRIRRNSQSAIRIELSEVPNNRIIEALLEKASDSSTALGFFVDLLERRFGEGFIEKKLERTFTPTLIGADVSCEGYEKIVEEENKKQAAETRAVRLLRSVVDRFFKEAEENPTESVPEPKTQRSFLGGLFDRIKTGLK